MAHRVSYALHEGEVPDDLMICHHCDNPICVNPAHLYAGTAKDNADDMMQRRRHWGDAEPSRLSAVGRALGKKNNWSHGSRNPKAKLSDEQVVAIFNDTRATRFVAREYGITRGHVQKIRRGDHWRTAILRAKETDHGQD